MLSRLSTGSNVTTSCVFPSATLMLVFDSGAAHSLCHGNNFCTETQSQTKTIKKRKLSYGVPDSLKMVIVLTDMDLSRRGAFRWSSP